MGPTPYSSPLLAPCTLELGVRGPESKQESKQEQTVVQPSSSQLRGVQAQDAPPPHQLVSRAALLRHRVRQFYGSPFVVYALPPKGLIRNAKLCVGGWGLEATGRMAYSLDSFFSSNAVRRLTALGSARSRSSIR
ncbi:hypothetical protein HaLaN_07072 [Haematococcus lacustris]|uniref:Uncharacterized protein n=1 Tax=Haematococcus lacustris TaxID=44745 RepID=A0A699YMP8_HAELA|nr:hypothetical protein HaLaN_07072 [Haematococcus lacustris]